MADRYEKIEKIGEGSYGQVWKVKLRDDPANSKNKFVLKLIRLEKASKKEREYAEQEVKLLKTLSHPNIVSFKDHFWYDSKQTQLGIVMSLCEGGDLYKVLKSKKGGGKLSEHEVMQWFIQIALAVQYLHSKNILHRDLKTQNIFLTRSNLVKVGDLGIARELKEDEMASTLIGTPYYMSPEIFQNIPYSYKSDIWSLGCILYEMTSLKHAFTAHAFSSLVHKIINGEPPKMPTGYSKGVCDLISRMLNREIEARPSARDILQTPFVQENIKKFLEESQSKQKRPSSSSVKGRPSSSKQKVVKKYSSVGRKNSESSDNSKLPAINSTPENVNNFDQDNIPTIKKVNNVVSQQGKSNSGSSSSLNKSPVKSNNLAADNRPVSGRPQSVRKVSEPVKSAATPSHIRKSSASSVASVSSVGSDSEVRRSKAREERLRKKEQEYAEKLVKDKIKEKVPEEITEQEEVLKPYSSNSNGNKEVSRNHSPDDDETDSTCPNSELDQTIVQRPVISDNCVQNSSPSQVESPPSGSPRWAEKLPVERKESVSSDVSHEANVELEEFVNVLSETLNQQQLDNEFPELVNNHDQQVNISANTLEPEMMQTITMSAKPKDRVAVIERELENVFDEEKIKVCMQILLNSNPTDNEESTEETLTDILGGKEIFEKYIGRFWHLMILSKSSVSKYGINNATLKN
ncbi:serine/threonine-protein kinase Nek4-like isoform X3 [Symsagittifera roscoffensis]|uniref:serine/threonine-protein kinase Nek4-like isoform X3 n=1 Tax=Symsagittifera roscoffensis TaxID=84072 RepID=UPI00307BBE87